MNPEHPFCFSWHLFSSHNLWFSCSLILQSAMVAKIPVLSQISQHVFSSHLHTVWLSHEETAFKLPFFAPLADGSFFKTHDIRYFKEWSLEENGCFLFFLFLFLCQIYSDSIIRTGGQNPSDRHSFRSLKNSLRLANTP